MRSDICSIPVEEVFEPCEGCPICRMRDMLENRMLEYIMGAAMMEPDVRKVTNEKGFCFDHFKMMLSRRNRLSIALMLDSHLAEIEKKVFGTGSFIKPSDSFKSARAQKRTQSCFVCENVDDAMTSLISNTLKHYENERDFRALFEKQEMLCLPHYSLLTAAADKKLSSRYKSDFYKAATKIAQKNIAELHADVKHFCDMYDYRNNGEDADWGNSKDSLERTVNFLCARDPEK